MSVFFISDREAQQARADAAQPSTRNQGFFDDPQGDGGAFEGIGQSFVHGLDTGAAGLTGWLANANRRIGYFAADEQGIGWRTDGEDWFTGYLEDLNEAHRASMRRTRIDPRTRSEAANMIGDLTSVLTAYTSAAAVGTPLGLGLLTGTAGGGMGLGYEEYDRLREMGADEETALGGARIAGTYGALGGAAPVSVPGRIVTRALTGAGLNVGLGAGQRGQTSAYLNEQGYPDLALQYNWLDPQAAVVDGLFGGIFGAAFGQRAPESVRPHAGDDDAANGEAPLLPPDADGFFEEARQYGTDEQFAEAYAYALIARDMGHPEADGLLATIEEDASAADIDAGTAIANQIAQSQLGASIPAEARDAARVQADTMQRATAFGIPVDAASRRWQSEAISRAEMQAARDEEIDVGPVPEGVDFVPLPDRASAEWEAALAAFEEEARAQGLDDVAGDVRRMREEREGDVGPLDDGALFSFGARRAPARGVESWRGEAGFSDPRLTEGERKAVEMARNNYSNAEIADELDTSAATVSALLSKARAKLGGAVVGRGIASGRPAEFSTERLVRMREELRRAGVPANKTKGSARTILSVMAERTGLSRDAVKQRLWTYDRQVETGAREPLKSMGALAREGRSTVEELQAVALDEFGDAWENLVRAGLAEIVQSKADVASERGLPRGVQAVHMRGADKSYFIANNIAPENLRGLILHELGVHHGMEEMLGERGKRALLRQVSAMVRAGQPDVARAMRFAKADNPGRPEVHAEEALAYLVEMQADLPLVQSMLSRVRQWLIKTFGTTFGMRLTVDDLRALAIASLRRLSERARREAADMTPIEPVPLYSKTPDAGAGRDGQAPDVGNSGGGLHPLPTERVRLGANRFKVVEEGEVIRRREGDPTYLDEARKWGPERAREPIFAIRTQDGKLEIVDGHHRHELARRRLQKLDAIVMPEEEYWAAIERGESQFDVIARAYEQNGLRRPRAPWDKRDPPNAPARGSGGDDPLFSMGARGQNALDPVESPRFQALLSDVEQRLIADGVLRERALGGEGAARGGGADQSGPNRAGGGESVSGRSGRGRGDNQGNAEPARIPRDIARDILSVSGLKLTRTTGVFGKYRASIDLPHDLTPEYAKAFADEGGEYPSALSFDLVEGATPRLFIRWSGLNPSLRNTGAGKWLYRQLIDWGLERGYEVYSDFSVSPSAQRIYTSLERMGYVIGRNPRAAVKSDGTLSTNDLKPVFRVRGGDTAEILMSAPAPRGGYEIGGPTLKERMAPMREEAARQAEYDALPAAEQILRDQPEMLFSFGANRMRADDLRNTADTETNIARDMTKGVDAAAHCAIRHGVGQAVARTAGASFITLNNQGMAGVLLGQVTGLALAVPVGVTAAPLIARDARRYTPQQRRLAELNYDIDQTQEAALRAMERAREHAGALGMDEPTNYESGKPVALDDVVDPNGADPMPEAGGTPWQDYTPPGGRPLLSGDAPDTPADYTPPQGGKTTPEGSPVSVEPAAGPSDNPSPPANGADLIDLFRPIVEGDE